MAAVNVKSVHGCLDSASNPSEIARRCGLVSVSSLSQSTRIVKLAADPTFMMLQSLQLQALDCFDQDCPDSAVAGSIADWKRTECDVRVSIAKPTCT